MSTFIVLQASAKTTRRLKRIAPALLGRKAETPEDCGMVLVKLLSIYAQLPGNQVTDAWVNEAIDGYSLAINQHNKRK